MKNHNHIRPINAAKIFPREFIDAFEEKWAAFIKDRKADPPAFLDDHQLMDAIKTVFIFSEFVSKRCVLNPKMLHGLIETGDLKRRYEIDA